MEWLQDVFLSEEYCCHKTSCESAHSPQISCLKVSCSILSYGNVLQRVAVVDVSPSTHIHRLSSSFHQTSTQLDSSFTGFYDVVINTLSFLQTCTFIWPKYPKMTFRLHCLMYNVFILVYLWDDFIFEDQKSQAGVATQDALLSPRIWVECWCLLIWMNMKSVLQYLIRMWCSIVTFHYTAASTSAIRSFSSI